MHAVPAKKLKGVLSNHICPQAIDALETACRCLAVLHLKGLEEVIGVSITHPTWTRTNPKDDHCGWAFNSPQDPPRSSPTGHGSFDCEDCVPDTINKAKFVRDLYDMAKDTTGEQHWRLR